MKYDYLDSDKKWGAMTGIICLVFAAAIGAAAGIISYYLIWTSTSSFFKNQTSKIVWISVTCFFLFIGFVCNISSGIMAINGSIVPKAVVVFSLLLGGLIPGILLFLHNNLWAAGLYASSYTSTGGGSSGGTSYDSGSDGKPRRPKYNREDDPRIVKGTSDDDDDDDEPKAKKKTSTPKSKRFEKAGKPT